MREACGVGTLLAALFNTLPPGGRMFGFCPRSQEACLIILDSPSSHKLEACGSRMLIVTRFLPRPPMELIVRLAEQRDLI